MKNKYLAPLMMPFLLVSLFGCGEKPSSSTSSSNLTTTLSTTSNSSTPNPSTPNPSTPSPSTPVISTPDPLPIDPKSVPLSHVPYVMSSFSGVTATETIANMSTLDTNHWKGTNATAEEQKSTVDALQYRIDAGIDSPRVVGSPVMAYSPRSKTEETMLDKKLHGVIDANGNVTELPQYASWQWALKFTKGKTDADSYFEIAAFIGGPAASRESGGVKAINNFWPAMTKATNGTREVLATQAIRHLGLGTNTDDDVLAANLIARGGYIQDYLKKGIDPVALIIPGYITVAAGDTLYTGVEGMDADEYDLRTSIMVGTDVNNAKAGTYPVKRGLKGAASGSYGTSSWNQRFSVLSQVFTPGFEEFGEDNASYLYNLRSLTYLGSSTFTTNMWGYELGYNYVSKLASLYYNASDSALKAAFNDCKTNIFKTNNQSLIDTPTGLTPTLFQDNSIC